MSWPFLDYMNLLKMKISVFRYSKIVKYIGFSLLNDSMLLNKSYIKI